MACIYHVVLKEEVYIPCIYHVVLKEEVYGLYISCGS